MSATLKFLVLISLFMSTSLSALECPEPLETLCRIVINHPRGDTYTNDPLGRPSRAQVAEIFTSAALAAYRTRIDRYARVEVSEPCTSTVNHHVETEKIGILQIKSFECQVVEETQRALLSLTNQGVSHFIIDVRNNGGGGLEKAVDVAALFIGPDIFFGTVRPVGQAEPSAVYTKSDAKQMVESDSLLVIITNKNTASAAELFTAALRAHGERTMLVGNKTFGKTLFRYRRVQEGIARISPGGVVTSAKGDYSGGIIPDVTILSGDDSAVLRSAVTLAEADIRNNN